MGSWLLSFLRDIFLISFIIYDILFSNTRECLRFNYICQCHVFYRYTYRYSARARFSALNLLFRFPRLRAISTRWPSIISRSHIFRTEAIGFTNTPRPCDEALLLQFILMIYLIYDTSHDTASFLSTLVIASHTTHLCPESLCYNIRYRITLSHAAATLVSNLCFIIFTIAKF